MGYSDFQFKTPQESAYESITAGTATASKAIILDGDKKISGIVLTDAKIDDIDAGVIITSADQTHANPIVTIPNIVDAADTFVVLDTAQTLTNKTLTTPVVVSLYQDAGKTKLMTVPNTASDTLVAIAATQTLTNKTLTSPKINEDVALTSTSTQMNSLINFPGTIATSIIDFNGVGEAGMKITINSVDYQEADVAVVTTGVWTNGASAADSATSLVAAINGDTRATVPFTATISTGGHSVILTYDTVGTAGNMTITTTSAANCTVENSVGGSASAIKQMVVVDRVVTAQDILANEINVPLSFAPTKFIIQHSDTNGEDNPTTWRATIATVPNRIRILGQGATALIAGDIVQILAFE